MPPKSFSSAIDFLLPTNRDELIALLWCFGELLQGDMQRRHDVLMKMIEDIARTNPMPLVVETVDLKDEPK